jgi:hypothetical protein
MENPQIGDIRVNENGAEQVFRHDVFGEDVCWQDTRKQLESQRWTYQCTDCERKEYTSVWANDNSGRTVNSDEYFARIAESEHKAPITYINDCEKCADDKYGKEED